MGTAVISDKDLVTQILDGQREAFTTLVERYLQSALAVARARLLNPIDADDAVQEAFLRAFAQLRTLREPGKFGPWLLTIVRHEAARFAVRHKSTVGADPTVAPEPAAEPNPSQQEIHALLRDQIERLPEIAREVLLLHYFAGRDTREIAELLGLRRAAVLKRLQRARETLAETMLRDLEVTKPSRDDVTKKAVKIVALAAALSIEQVVPAAAAAATTATSVSLLTKVLAAGILVVGAVGIGMVMRAVNRSEDQPPVPGVQMAAAIEPTPVEAAPDTPTSPAPTPKLTLPQSETPATTTAADSESEVLSLNGSWEVTGLPEIFGNEVMIVEFKQNGSSVAASGVSGEFRLRGDGTLIGDLFQLTFLFAYAHSSGDIGTLTLEGSLGVDRNSFGLDGKLAENTGTYSVQTPNGPVTGSFTPAPIPLHTKWKRLVEKSLSFRAFVVQKTHEIEQLGKALGNYYTANNKTLPATLDELVPKYLDSFMPYSREGGAELQYAPSNRSLLEYTGIGVKIQDVFRGNYRPDLAMPDRLTAYEQDLKGFWTEPLPFRALVTATYSAHPVRLYLKQDGDVKVTLMDSASRALPAHRQFLAEQRAACANNLKQLGLTLKMFMNECPDEYSAPGWLSVYPEYAPDRNLFTCPNHQPGVFSYRIIWPTANELELRQFYKDRFGDIGRYPDAYIPFVIETDECSFSGGRSVLFLDGHVEYITGPLEQNPKIAPFLNLH